MANLLPVTLQDIQSKINTLTSSSIDTPASNDDQWLIRLNYINLAVSSWASKDILWRELYITYTASATISTSRTYAIDGVNDFRMMASLLRLTDVNGSIKYIDIIEPDKLTAYRGNGRVAYITGNPAIGYTLNLGWTPAVGDSDYGNTISFDYYSAGTKLANPTDKPQMSDPDYIIYWAAAQELSFNSRSALGANYQTMAEQCMDNMIIRNELLPAYASREIEDLDGVRGGAIWGL